MTSAHSQDFDASTQGLLALVRDHLPRGGGDPAAKGGKKGKTKG